MNEGITFRCPNCDVEFGVVPKVEYLQVRSHSIVVGFQEMDFEHRCEGND